MSDTPFILPAGLSLSQGDDGLSIEYDGDIVLHATLGGSVARLSSTGGDIVLHIPLKVGTIEAAGQLRANADLQVDELIADSAEVGGELTATSTRISNTLDCEGAVRADHLAAADVQCAALTVEQLDLTGKLETSGDMHIGRGRAGTLRCGGSLSSDDMQLSGEVVAIGDIDVEKLAASSLSAGGDLRSAHIEVGALSVDGDLHAEQMSADEAVIHGKLTATSLTAGSLQVDGALTATQVRVKGAIHLHGDVDADRLEAASITADGGSLQAKVLIATESIELGAIAIRSDIVMAPCVSLNTKASGRISVLESGNDLEPTQIKGCLSLEDVEDLFGNAEQFLADRGLSRLGQGALASSVANGAQGDEEQEPEPEPEPQDETRDDVEQTMDGPLFDEDEVELLSSSIDEVDDLDPGSEPNMTVASIQVDPQAREATPDDNRVEDPFGWADQMLTEVVAEGAIRHPDAEEEQTGPISSADTSQAEPLEAESESAAVLSASDILEVVDDEDQEDKEQANPLHAQMRDSLTRIVACYAHAEQPPAIGRLRDLVDSRDYARIRLDITDIWNQLLHFHQKRGLRIQPQVTTTFNTINSLVRKL